MSVLLRRRGIEARQSGSTPSFPAPWGAWGFEEGSGLVAADSSGNGHNLTVQDASWVAGHLTGSALQYVRAAGTAAAYIEGLTKVFTSFTLGTWLFQTTIGSNGDNTSPGLVFGDDEEGYINWSTGEFFLPGQDGSNGPALYATPSQIGTWHYVAVTFDGSTASFYLDAVLQGTVARTGAVTEMTSIFVQYEPWWINSTSIWDNMRIWDTALTQAQLSAAMSTPV